VDSESNINAVSSKVIERFELKAISYPHPHKVSLINSTALKVKQRCLIMIDFNSYKDKIWCDMVTMNVGQIILGRSWLFDKDITIYGLSNMCQFEHNGKKNKLLSFRLKV